MVLFKLFDISDSSFIVIEFTFHYGPIQIVNMPLTLHSEMNLHSTMVLFKLP